ncbi:MAG: hypothetical protein MPJ50_15720 [Pirellulales bacterium]|nr:hypothetical protein [Pirellulales bacterium]
MPRVKRKGTRLKNRWNDQQLQRLFIRGIAEPYGLAPEREPQGEEWNIVRKAWESQHEEIFEDFRKENPGRRPFAWWQWETAVERDSGLPEIEQLWRLGELTDAEAQEHHTKFGHNLPEGCRIDYRRPWLWWHERRENTPRRYELPEAFDLFDQRLLTDEERGALQDMATDRYAAGKVYTPIIHQDRHHEPGITTEQLRQMGLHAAAELYESPALNELEKP